MTIILPDTLPAAHDLREQGIQVLTPDQASNQDICPLKIGLLNLMPSTVKQRVELQIVHVLHSPLQIRLYPIWFDHFKSESAQPYLDQHYTKISAIQDEGLDGLIVTGANLEHVPFHEVQFFEELTRFLHWADNSVASTIYSCWSAHARLFIDYGCERVELPQKVSGVFSHTVVQDPLTYGLDDCVAVPHSRNTAILSEHIRQKGLHILMESSEAGWHLLTDEKYTRIFLQGHPEYDTKKLHEEYTRDRGGNKETKIPQNYYPSDDISQTPLNLWSANSGIFFRNWLNIVYQNISHQSLK